MGEEAKKRVANLLLPNLVDSLSSIRVVPDQVLKLVAEELPAEHQEIVS
jgi:hypothetical protein